MPMEDATPLKEALFKALSAPMRERGFTHKVERDNFFRRDGDVTEIFQVTCTDARPGYRIKPGVSVRHEQVEAIFHRTSGFEKKYQADTPTLGAAVGALLGGSPRDAAVMLAEEGEIPGVVEKLVAVFEQHALPYFRHWASLAAVDASLNDDPAARSPNRALAWFRCSTAIIAARLTGRAGYAELAEFYRGVMEKDNKGFYLKRFEALLADLESVPPGSGGAA